MRHQVRHSSSNALDCQIDAWDCRILLVTTSGTRSDGNFVTRDTLGSESTTMFSISDDLARERERMWLLIFRGESTCLSDREMQNLFLGGGELHEAALGLGLGPGHMVGRELALCGF